MGIEIWALDVQRQGCDSAWCVELEGLLWAEDEHDTKESCLWCVDVEVLCGKMNSSIGGGLDFESVRFGRV